MQSAVVRPYELCSRRKNLQDPGRNSSNDCVLPALCAPRRRRTQHNGLSFEKPPLRLNFLRSLCNLGMSIRSCAAGEYQQSLSRRDPSDQWPFARTLRSISTYIDSVAGRADSNAPTFTAGFQRPEGGVEGAPSSIRRESVRCASNGQSTHLVRFGSRGAEEVAGLLRSPEH